MTQLILGTRIHVIVHPHPVAGIQGLHEVEVVLDPLEVLPLLLLAPLQLLLGLVEGEEGEGDHLLSGATEECTGSAGGFIVGRGERFGRNRFTAAFSSWD